MRLALVLVSRYVLWLSAGPQALRGVPNEISITRSIPCHSWRDSSYACSGYGNETLKRRSYGHMIYSYVDVDLRGHRSFQKGEDCGAGSLRVDSLATSACTCTNTLSRTESCETTPRNSMGSPSPPSVHTNHRLWPLPCLQESVLCVGIWPLNR